MRAGSIMVMLVVLGGCAFRGGAAATARENRSLNAWPWVLGANVTPTPADIQGAVANAYHSEPESCPFSLLRCGLNNPRLQAQVLTITDVRCRYVESYSDRCSFRMTETVAGAPAARSRCTAFLRIVGTAHSMPAWELDYLLDAARRVTCTPER